MKKFQAYLGPIAAALAFMGSFGFFQFAYPYHLMRREQMNLFLFDWDYIRQTYHGAGWLARFVSAFLDQFFHLPVVGPVVIALALTGIGFVVYKICRKLLGKWPSLIIAALVFAWSFLRETENLYCTRYTLVVLGYLTLILAALQFKKWWMKLATALIFIAFGLWALGTPYNRYYGKWWGTPVLAYDRVIGLDTEVARENWDKVIKLSEKDLHMTEASYCRNLALAMKGELASRLFSSSQKDARSLFIRVSTSLAPFPNSLAGEAWFHLGDMTIAEQSAIIALQASPHHTGTRYIKRLARVNLISGEYGAAQKYLGLLSKTLFYGKWARKMLSGIEEDSWLQKTRARLAHTDFVHSSTQPRAVLLGLLEADPTNRLAREYLLCYDLLSLDLDRFMEDYTPEMAGPHTYQEAILIWLSVQDLLTEEKAAEYGIGKTMIDRMEMFFASPSRFKDTYWYYYMNKMNEE